MASKKILLLLDSGNHAVSLPAYLASNAKMFDWKIKVGTMPDSQLEHPVETTGGRVELLDIKKLEDCDGAIRKSDLVIAMLNDSVLLQIADSCIRHRKTLISPARLTRQMAVKKALAKENNVLILMDCGFSPGLDHIIAKKAIDNIHSKGGSITSFKTFSGAFISGTSEPNPFEFKPTESAAETLAWGRHNNRYLKDGRLQQVPHHRLFERGEPKDIVGQQGIVAVPEGDSLYYKKIYDLCDARTVVRGKLLRTGIDRLWTILLKLGMMDSSLKVDMTGERTIEEVVESLLPAEDGAIHERLKRYTGADDTDIEKLRWLGLFDGKAYAGRLQETTACAILQQLMEDKFRLLPTDQDCLIMEHELSYELREESHDMVATLVLNGVDQKDSALARVIAIMCGAAAKSVLLGTVKTKGVHIPILREIYEPILTELEDAGIAFRITEKKLHAVG